MRASKNNVENYVSEAGLLLAALATLQISFKEIKAPSLFLIFLN